MSISIMGLVFYADIPVLKYQHLIQKKKSGEQEWKVITVSSARAKSILQAYADHANDDGESAYPSISRLMIKTGLSRMAVIQGKKALVQNGYLNHL